MTRSARCDDQLEGLTVSENMNWERNLTLLSSKGRGVLVTLKADGRPQLSNIDFCYDPQTRLLRLSTTDDRAKVRNLRRDPRVSLYVSTPGGGSYAVYEGIAELSPVSTAPDDAAVEELVDIYRAIAGEHPDWDEYRAAMVADRRLVVRFRIEYAYGWVPS
jgi:PPOX class probable F420-dependent enzyme